jgi:hypothetical protein
MTTEDKLRSLLSKVEAISPHLVDHWQTTAIVESLGYTDRSIQEEFGFADALALGQHIYDCHQSTIQPQIDHSAPTVRQTPWAEFCIFLTEFCRSFVYAVPLLAVLTLEYLPLKHAAQWLPPELATLFTLATIASLSTSGGFVQMIQRRGLFYLQLGEMKQVRWVCNTFLKLGMGTSLFMSFISIWFGFYRNLFADQYLILAIFYYLSLSALWMLFAVLSLLLPWGTPIALVSLTGLFLVLRVLIGMGALEAQILTMCMTLVAIAAVIFFQFWQQHASQKGDSQKSSSQSGIRPPRISTLVYLLSPYFGYGVLYFAFIFADRITAGLAINPASGLIFAIDSNYQRSLDLSLLNFLLFVPLVEYFSHIFIRYWYQRSSSVFACLSVYFTAKLRRRYRRAIWLTIGSFGGLIPMTLALLKPQSWELAEVLLTIAGSFGYLLFAIGLLNAIILFSLNQAPLVLQAIAPALMLNLCIGYVLAHLIGASYAVIGLIIGSATFMLLSGRSVGRSIQQPDYGYYLGGY